MPTHKSCKKRMRTSAEVSQRNRALRSNVRNAIKAVRTEQNKEEARKKLRIAGRLLDRAASYGIMPRKRASRNKSRLTQFVNKLG